MSSGTRTQRTTSHAKLLRRAENFKAVIPQAETLRQVALQILGDNPPEDEFESDEIGEMIQLLMPSSNELLIASFLRSPVYPIALLHDVSQHYSCLSMPVEVTQGIKDEFKSVRPLQQVSWLGSTVYEMPVEDVNNLLEGVSSLRSTSVAQIVSELRAQASNQEDHRGERSSQGNQNQQENGDARRNNQPVDVLPPVQEETGNRRGPNGYNIPTQGRPSTNYNAQDSARAVQAIYGAFKDKKFSGDSLQSIQETVRDYNILSNQMFMDDVMKAKFFICIFEDAAKSHFIANCQEDMTFAQMEKVMRNEFESDARRLQVHMTLRGLSISRVMSDNDDVTDESEALNWLVKRINKLTPQCPEGFRSEDNKIQFLRDAVLGKE